MMGLYWISTVCGKS